MRRSTLLLRTCPLVLAALAACGGDDATDDRAADPGHADGDMTVLAEDIGFDRDTYRASPGRVRVVYENQGRIRHTLRIEGRDDFELSVTSNGDVDEGSVALEPGTYRLYCDVAGHEAAGMAAELRVG